MGIVTAPEIECWECGAKESASASPVYRSFTGRLYCGGCWQGLKDEYRESSDVAEEESEAEHYERRD